MVENRVSPIIRCFFRKKLQHILKAEAVRKSKNPNKEDVERHRSWSRRMSNLYTARLSSVPEEVDDGKTERRGAHRIRRKMKKVRPEMIRRVDGTPRLVNPSGWISEQIPERSTPVQGQSVRVIVNYNERAKSPSISESESSESDDG